MFGVSIDDSPDGPVGSPATRRAIAIHWNWTTDYSNEEIATALGVTTQTVEKYLSSGPNEEVKAQMEGIESEVRLVAVAELKSQLQRAGHVSRTAEKPVKVWQDDDGHLRVRDVYDDEGELVSKKPIPTDLEMGPDQTARYFRREEVREILDRLVELVGAAEPERHEIDHSGDVSGEFSINITHHRVTDDVTGGEDDEPGE